MIYIVIEADYKFEPTKDTPYIAITGELWGVFYEDLGENWPLYNDIALYLNHYTKVPLSKYVPEPVPAMPMCTAIFI